MNLNSLNNDQGCTNTYGLFDYINDIDRIKEMDEATTVAERYLSLKYQPHEIVELEAKIGHLLKVDGMGDPSVMFNEILALENEHKLTLQTIEALLRKNQCQTFIVRHEIIKGINIVRFETSQASNFFTKPGSYKKNFLNLRQCTSANIGTTHLGEFVATLSSGPETVTAKQDGKMKPIFEAERRGDVRSFREAIELCHREDSLKFKEFEVEAQVKTEAFTADNHYSISELAALDLMLLEVIRLGAVCDEDNTLITEAIESCVQKYDLSIQQIEAHLRFRQCHVFIIAQKPPSGEMYEILVSTKYGMELLKDLTKQSKNYSENFDKLAHITLSAFGKSYVKSYQHEFQRIVEADKSGDMPAVAREIVACIKKYKVTLEAIELNLRSHRCNAHLIAKPSEKLSKNVDGISKKHHMLVCDSKQAAELFPYQNAYCKNFEKLNDTGIEEQSDDVVSTIPGSELLRKVYSSHIISSSGLQRKLRPILKADRERNYNTIFTLVEWYQKNYDVTLEEIELFLRMKNGSAYLIAGKEEFNCKILDLDEEKKYSLKIVSKEQAEEHFVHNAISWSENLWRLLDTGWDVIPAGPPRPPFKIPKPAPSFNFLGASLLLELSYVTKKEIQGRTLVLTFKGKEECEFADAYLKKDPRKWFANVEPDALELFVTFLDGLDLNQKHLNEFASTFNHAFRRRNAVSQPLPPAKGSSTGPKNKSAENPKGKSLETPKRTDGGEKPIGASANIPKGKREKNTRKRAGAKEVLTDKINAKLMSKKLEREALARRRFSPRATNGQPSTQAILPVLQLPMSLSDVLTPVKLFLEPPSASIEADTRSGGVELKRLPKESEAVITQPKEKKKFSNEIDKRIRSARTSLRDLADFRARVQRQEYDPKKPWVSLAYQHHLFQACEALQPTDKRKIEEREIDHHEQAFKQLLEEYCIPPDEVFDLRNILRSSVKITSKDTSEVVERLLAKESKHDKNIEDLLKEVTNKRNEKLSIKKCTIFKRRWNLKNNPQRNLMLLRKIPGQLNLLKNTVSDCMQALEKFRDFDCVENSKKFRILAFDHSAAIRMLFTRIGKLLARIKPFPGILVASPEIMDLRILANTNAHDIRKLLRGGGESESIPAKAIFQRLIEEDSTYLSNIEAAINKAIALEEKRCAVNDKA